jgi:hypothetical protein
MITRDDWLRALSDANESVADDPEAITIGEFAQMFGLKQCVAAYRLRNLHNKGRALRTSKRGFDGAGRYKTLTAYRLVEQDKKPKRKTA